MVQNVTDAMELGFFIDGVEERSESAFGELLSVLGDRVILPSMWQVVDEDGAPASVLDSLIGYNRFVSFHEIAGTEEAPWTPGVYGLGFTRDFLQGQGVAAVTYLTIDPDEAALTRDALIRNGLETILENWDSFQYFRRRAAASARSLQSDPERQAFVHEMVVHYANDTRTYYELVHAEDAMRMEEGEAFVQEWRGMEPIKFSMDDVQTIYVATAGEGATVRRLCPSYAGEIVALGSE